MELAKKQTATQSQKLMVFVLTMALYGLATLFTELIPSFQVGVAKTYEGKREAHLSDDAVRTRAIATNDGMTFFFGNSMWRNARIYVDTNGSAKGPNRLGFDLFAFDVDKTDKIVPAKNTAENVLLSRE